MKLSVTSPDYLKLGAVVLGVLLVALSTIPALVTVANWMADLGKILVGIGIVSIQGNAAAVEKEAAELKAKAEAVVKAAQ